MSNIYSIKILKSIDDLENYRESWEKLQWHPHTDIDFYKIILTSRKEILRPHVLVILNNSEVIGLVICRLEHQFIDCKIGYKTIFRPKMKMLTVLYGGFLGFFTPEMSDMVITELFRSLNDKEADVIYFNVIRKNGFICNLLKDKYRNIGIKNNNIVIHWKINLPNNMNDYLKTLSVNHRNKIRRYPRILENDFPGKIQYICYRKEEDVNTICKDAEIVAAKTYHRGLGVGFKDNYEYKQRLLLQARNGRLLAFFLYIEGEPVAFYIGNTYKEIFHFSNTGYDSKLKKYELGSILLIRIIEDLIKLEPKVNEIDFGFGDAFYKSRFGTEYWEEVEFYIFSKSFKTTLVNLTRGGIKTIDNILRWIVAKINMENKIKKAWRDCLTG